MSVKDKIIKTKAFIFAGNRHQYQCFIRENHLDKREYPQLTEDNWYGIHGVDVIRIGTYFENSKLLDMLPHIELHLRDNFYPQRRIGGQMSVSLREKEIRKIIKEVFEAGESYKEGQTFNRAEIIREGIFQVNRLFPTQLTEEEVEKILPKKLNVLEHHEKYHADCHRCIEILAYNQAIDDCKSALIGKCGNVNKDWEKEFDKQFVGELRYEAGDADIGLIDAGEEGIEKIKEFIRKLIATPTFSGGEKPQQPPKPKCEYDCHCVWIEVAKRWIWFCNKCGEYITKDTGCSNPMCPEHAPDCECNKCKPTEQKECLHEWWLEKVTATHGMLKCKNCGIYQSGMIETGKPIPAEKKELREEIFHIVFEAVAPGTTEGDIGHFTDRIMDKIFWDKQKKQPEPKPKDRIEFEFCSHGDLHSFDITELIRHINKES